MADDAGPGNTDKNTPHYREVTISAIVFGVVVGAVMNAAITYAGLKIGFTIGGSAIAAVLGFGVLRGILRKGTILETNIGQTSASAVNTSNSGVIFTVPVLLLIGIPLVADSLDFWLITLACVAGALLGTAFIIPLRKQMIDIDRLRFPTGTGVATILKSPGAGPAKAIALLVGIAIGALIYAPTGLEQLGFEATSYGALGDAIFGADQQILTGEKFNLGELLSFPGQYEIIFAIAPFALGAGFITGRAGLLVLAGGLLAYFVLTPIAFANGWMPQTVLENPSTAPQYGFDSFNKPLGVGLLLGGAIMGIIASLPSVKAALMSVGRAGASGKGGSDELGLRPLIIAALGAVLLLFLAADFVTSKPLNDRCPVTDAALADLGAGQVQDVQYKGYVIELSSEDALATWEGWDNTQRMDFLGNYNAKPGLLSGLPHHLRALVIAVIGALWIWLAGIIIAQCTGMTDWSPISGMALLTVVLVMLLAGSGAVVGAVLIGAALCVAITLAADMMQDLRTGHLIGGKPKRQQVVELSVVWIGPVIAMLVVLVIAGANMKQFGVAMGPGTSTPAPQAQALQSVITGVQGGEMPYALYGFGALLGALLGLGAFSGLGVLVGLSMYLPFIYIATYGIGCIVQMILSKVKGKSWTEEWGVPVGAGLIVGESVFALIVNIIILVSN